MADPTIRLRKNFGASVRAIRKERRLSQEKLSFAAGISLTYVGEIERGEKMPSLDVVVRIANALDLTAANLLQRSAL